MKVEWHDAIPQLEELAERIVQLNQTISALPDLGPEYELGAAVFGDLPYFVGQVWRYKTQGRKKAKILWANNGLPCEPLRSLWDLTLEPVLSQYLAGSDQRAEQLEELRLLLLTRSSG